jgi:sugar/nucleoside kinase (ribokinase family)
MGSVMEQPKGLFVGLCTLDIIQLVDHVPGANEKLTARDQIVAAGGPAANAAVTLSHLGGSASLLTGIGTHPLTQGIVADLAGMGVEIVDLAGGSAEAPTVSSILVTAATGERAVASTNAISRRLSPPQDLDRLVSTFDVLEFDGHHMDVAIAAARAARAAGRPTVFDGGSWKKGTEELLSSIDVAVCSADFRPPGAASPTDTLRFLQAHAVPWSAVSRGDAPIIWAGPDACGEVAVPSTPVLDTLGAGDVLHGALTYYIAARDHHLDAEGFAEALGLSALVASRACASFGTRSWTLKD